MLSETAGFFRILWGGEMKKFLMYTTQDDDIDKFTWAQPNNTWGPYI